MINRNNCLFLFAHHVEENSLLYKDNFPNELIREVLQRKHILDLFTQALTFAAYGSLNQLKGLLRQYPELIWLKGDVVKPGGLIAKDITILECAFLGGDPEMVAMILPFFNKLNNGQYEKLRQLTQCYSALESSYQQEPYALITLFDIIKHSSDESVRGALNKEMDRDDALKHALKTFREAVNPMILTKQSMHYHYKTLIHAFELLENEWKNLKRGDNYERNDLIWRQIIGYLERYLPAVERFIFARGLFTLKSNGEVSERSMLFKHGDKSFPDTFTDTTDFTGLGFDYGIWAAHGPRSDAIVSNVKEILQQLFQDKFRYLQDLCSDIQPSYDVPTRCPCRGNC